MKYAIPYLKVLLIFSLFTACSNENDGSSDHTEEYNAIQQVINEGNLLLHTEEQGGQTIFTFENREVTIPTETIETIREDVENWKTILTLVNKSELNIPTLGKSLHLTSKNIQVNPTGYAPLSAQLTISFPVEGKLKVCIKGKNGHQNDLSHLFSKIGYNHQEYIHGLYPNCENKIYITFTDKNGKERLTDSVTVTTTTPDDLVPDFFAKIQVKTSHPDQMEPGLTIVQDMGGGEYDAHRPYMLDSDGDVRWYLWLRNHPELNISAHTGFKRLRNGNFLSGDSKTGNLFEFDMVGNLIKKWNIKGKGYTFHHEVTEMPNGNLLAAVTKDNHKNSLGEYTKFDFIIEVNRESGEIVTEWDLNKSLDSTRDALISIQEAEGFKQNWAHSNAVLYSPEDDCIIVSNRYQGLIKLTRDNKLNWFLTPHRGTQKLQYALLTPLDQSGQKIVDADVLDGNKEHPDFDWEWGGHCPVFLPNGHILLFDNGYRRRHKEIDLYGTEGYSRAVEYAIDAKNMTVKQVWEYGHHERGRNCYAVALSSVQYLPQKDHVLFGPGVGTPNLNGGGGKIVEVDRKTKEVVYEVHLSRPGYMVFHRVERIPLYPDNL
ncbi:aryl-sulfate sulfotransferase [Bacteroides sp.]|uniref:aryl-sulfate sulfotransferase n=1 Tax=Bacteroides sp. TaxID=29523 RepID=UPI002FC727CC